jgi:hypothetical protein
MATAAHCFVETFTGSLVNGDATRLFYNYQVYGTYRVTYKGGLRAPTKHIFNKRA